MDRQPRRVRLEAGNGLAKIRAMAGVLLLGSLATACSPLRGFDALVPKDGGGIRGARGQAYGAGPRRMLDIYAPRGRASPDRLRPIILFFYGGSWSSGTREGYAFVGK